MRGRLLPVSDLTLALPPRIPWEEAPSGPPKSRQDGNEEGYGKVKGGAGDGRHGISEVAGV